MSTFYLLPSRPQLGEQFAHYLSTLFPGLNWPQAAWAELGETLAGLAARQPDVFVVHREELPSNEDAEVALSAGFGAAAGDEVVEVHPDQQGGQLLVRRWQVD